MDRRTYLRATGLALTGIAGFAGCLGSGAEGDSSVAIEGVNARAETVLTDLEIPWGTTVRKNELFLTERPGRLLRVPDFTADGSVRSTTVADLTESTESIGEGGLLGLAFHPNDRNCLYVYQTHRGAGGLENRVLRGDVSNSEPTFEPIIEGIPAASTHNGGRLAMTDGALFVSTGDASRGDPAQDRSSLAGKILRYTPAGDPHPENPFDNPVFTYGHRNPQGIAFGEHTIYGVEHGPDHDDEINALEPGGNYGWPAVMGPNNTGEYIDPLTTYTPTIAPASAAIYRGPIAEWRGSLCFGALAGTFLGRVTIEADGVARGRSLEGTFGRLRTTVTGPDRHLYVTTSNRDGRGSPAEPDDRLLRIRPD